jgi:hypothetical protein
MDRNEAIKIMVGAACNFAEFYYYGDEELGYSEKNFVEYWSGNGKLVESFHPTSGDRVIMSHLAAELLDILSPEYLTDGDDWIEPETMITSMKFLGLHMLFNFFYPRYRSCLALYHHE